MRVRPRDYRICLTGYAVDDETGISESICGKKPVVQQNGRSRQTGLANDLAIPRFFPPLFWGHGFCRALFLQDQVMRLLETKYLCWILLFWFGFLFDSSLNGLLY